MPSKAKAIRNENPKYKILKKAWKCLKKKGIVYIKLEMENVEEIKEELIRLSVYWEIEFLQAQFAGRFKTIGNIQLRRKNITDIFIVMPDSVVEY